VKFLDDIKTANDVVKKIKENQNKILAGIGAIALMFGLFYGYSYYKRYKEERAHRSFVAALEYFNAPVKKDGETPAEDLSFLDKKEFKTETEKWEKVESVFKQGYENNSGSGIASMFLTYRSEALLKLGKFLEAIESLQLGISKMKNEKVKSYFKVKLALMLIDTKDKNMVDEGLQILKNISLDENNISHDLALYQIGQYYWNSKNFEEAKNYWNQLLLKYGKTEKRPSPWVEIAKERLKLIDPSVE